MAQYTSCAYLYRLPLHIRMYVCTCLNPKPSTVAVPVCMNLYHLPLHIRTYVHVWVQHSGSPSSWWQQTNVMSCYCIQRSCDKLVGTCFICINRKIGRYMTHLSILWVIYVRSFWKASIYIIYLKDLKYWHMIYIHTVRICIAKSMYIVWVQKGKD